LWIHEIVIAYDFLFQTAVIIACGVYLNLNKIRFILIRWKHLNFKITFTDGLC